MLLLLISILKYYEYTLLDSQFFNQHLLQFGAHEISNKSYQLQLQKSVLKIGKFPKIFSYQKSLTILHSLSHKS